MVSARDDIERLLARADIEIGGSDPWDITVHDARIYHRVLAGGSLALGESYMDGWWDVAEPDAFICRLLKAGLDTAVVNTALIWNTVKGRLFNEGARHHAFAIAKEHYDLGNDLFEKMLDARLTYSCGYWKEANALDGAQEAKLDLICRKIGLKKGDRVLDIGCGWGSFAIYAAEKYGASVVGVTVSEEQARLARQRAAGLPVEIRVADYRSLNEPFDHIVSIGMFEHVGYKNYRTFFEVAARCLKDGGLFLLHTIGNNRSVVSNDAWMAKYIFPHGILPSVAQIGKSTENLFKLEDWHSFGPYYDRTLTAWFANFRAAWPSLKDRYGERFYRMWTYYLLSCAGAFRARHIQLWQIVLSKHGVPGGYESVR
jgi:cyclopropane-fatty-acyl-phospholipid synthase